MADKYYVVILCAFSFMYCVTCELNLSEGSPCITNGYNGTCIGLYKCNLASLTFILKNAGYRELPEFPDVCSHENNELVVCCTDCFTNKNETCRNKVIIPEKFFVNKEGSIARQKCLENFQRLPYRCRGKNNIKVKRIWNETKKCHDLSVGTALAVGGRSAQRWEFPHVALLGYGADVESAQWLCGGSVISERFILTAAHCSGTHTLGNITYAALGLLKRTDPKKYWKIYKIKRIIMHPEYLAPSKYHDIALLETEDEINFGRDLLPACLYQDDTIQDSTEWYSETSGWGRAGHKQNLADTLQVVYLQEYKETECAGIYGPHRHLQNGYDHEKQMCYGRHNEIVDTCEGDSGGPLQVNLARCLYTIKGVTSYGKDCGILGSPGMYTRVSYYVPWIESVVWPEETEAQKQKDCEWLDKLLRSE